VRNISFGSAFFRLAALAVSAFAQAQSQDLGWLICEVVAGC
jgi:hypothetical protein